MELGHGTMAYWFAQLTFIIVCVRSIRKRHPNFYDYLCKIYKEATSMIAMLAGSNVDVKIRQLPVVKAPS